MASFLESRSLLCVLLGIMLFAACTASATNPHTVRTEARQKCYERCMKRFGWRPVCVFAPDYPEGNKVMPDPQWVMPNRCTMNCMVKYRRYEVYANVKVKKSAKVPKSCQKDVQGLYFDFTSTRPRCTTC